MAAPIEQWTLVKKCPMCAEEIQDAAKKCKHCGEYLTESDVENPAPETVEAEVELPQIEPERTFLGKRSPGSIPAAILLFLGSGALFALAVDYGWDSTFRATCVVLMAMLLAFGALAGVTRSTHYKCPLCRMENSVIDGNEAITCSTCKLPLKVEWQGESGKKTGLVSAPPDSIKKSLSLGTVPKASDPGCLFLAIVTLVFFGTGAFFLRPSKPSQLVPQPSVESLSNEPVEPNKAMALQVLTEDGYDILDKQKMEPTLTASIKTACERYRCTPFEYVQACRKVHAAMIIGVPDTTLTLACNLVDKESKSLDEAIALSIRLLAKK